MHVAMGTAIACAGYKSSDVPASIPPTHSVAPKVSIGGIELQFCTGTFGQGVCFLVPILTPTTE